MKRIILILLLTIPLSGCLLVLLPVALGLQTASFTMQMADRPSYCVTTLNNVGEKIRMPNGKMGIIEKLHGPHSACTSITPIGATISEEK